MANTQSAMQAGFGFNLQSAKGTAATVFKYLPTLSVNVGVDQRAQAIPPEIGGSLWQRGSYKQSMVVAGDVAFNVRPDHIGYLLYALTGAVAATTVSTTRLHKFYPADSQSLPWLSLRCDCKEGPDHLFKDCVVRSFRLEIPNNQLVTATVGFLGIDLTDQADSGDDIDASEVEKTPVLNSCVATAALTGVTSSVAPATRISLDFGNQVSEDEFVIGSYQLDNITLLQRTLNVTFDTFVRDATLWRLVHRNGAAGAGSWDPVIYQGQLDVLVQVPGDSTRELRVLIPKMDYLTFPISLQGNQLVRATLTAQVSLVAGENDSVAAVAGDTALADFDRPYVIQLTNTRTTWDYSTPAS